MKKFSHGTGMSFGLDKCVKATFNRGNLTGPISAKYDQNTVIKDLAQEEVYKYLGVDENS